MENLLHDSLTSEEYMTDAKVAQNLPKGAIKGLNLAQDVTFNVTALGRRLNGDAYLSAYVVDARGRMDSEEKTDFVLSHSQRGSTKRKKGARIVLSLELKSIPEEGPLS